MRGARRFLGTHLLLSVLGAVLLSAAEPAAGQEAPRLTVRVRQVAGTTLYLDVGTRHGLQGGDTVGVARDSLGPLVGHLVVTAATDRRSVLTFPGTPFPVTRGDVLTLMLRRPAADPAPALLPATPQAGDPPVRPSPRTTPSHVPVQAASEPAQTSAGDAYGSATFGVAATRSSTRFGGASPVSVPRTYATPSLHLDLTVPDAAGGFTFRLGTRLAYRYSSTATFARPTSVRVYSAALERTFTSVPVRLSLGRFHSPAESFSGFWDGVFVRVGGTGMGVGALLGFEPDRWNERPSAELPKATVFVDGRVRGDGWRWWGDVSAHTVRPADSLATHTFLGVSQGLRAGPLAMSQDLQLDRDPAGGMRVSQLRVRSSLDLGAMLQVRAAVSRRETFLLTRPDDPFGLRRDRLSLGGLLHGSGGFFALDGALTRDALGDESVGLSASFGVERVPALGAGLGASVARFSGTFGHTLSLAPTLTFQGSRANLRVGYRLHRSHYLQSLLTTHGVEASLDAPFLPGLHLSARGRVQWGNALSSQSLDLILRRAFGR